MITEKYVLTMTEEQAQQTIAALDFWMRMRIGQWKELVDLCLPVDRKNFDEWCKQRDNAELLIMSVRDKVMPDLPYNASWGVYKFPETERAFNVLQAIRSCIAWHKHPEGGITVNFDDPMAVNVAEPMPKCEVMDDEGEEGEDDDAGQNKPTAAQIDYAETLMQKTGYDAYDVRDIFGKEFDDLTRSEMARFIDGMKRELEG